MAIILRADKGTPLSHTELDNNFRQLFYSASFSGTQLSLFTSASLDNEVTIPFSTPYGKEYYVQYKEGNATSGSNSSFSGSANFLYDYRQLHLKHTGSFSNIGDATIDGNLTVTGTVTAQEMRTEFNNSSVVFESGSTKFGDTADDTHSFTGSLELQGSLTSSADLYIADWGSVSASLASNLYTENEASASQAADHTALSSSLSNRIAATSSSLAERIQSGSDSVQATYLRNTTDTLAGDLTVTGRINATEISTTYVTSSILYNSGSNIFGDAVSDVHIFTGSLLTEQSISGSDIRINEWGSVSSSLASINTTVGALSTEYSDLQNIPSSIISSSAQIVALGISSDYSTLTNVPSNIVSGSSIGSVVQGQVKLTTNGISSAVGIGLTTADSPTFTDLTLTNFASVSASLAALTAGTITISNDANNRVLTGVGNSTLNGEADLTFDGSTLTVSGTGIGTFTNTNSDITGLIGGSAFGTLITGVENAHVAIGLKGNDTGDSFAIISGNGDYYTDDIFDKLCFKVTNTGVTTIGGNLTVNGAVSATGDITAYFSSDERLKDNIELINDPIQKVKQIKGVSFDWNDQSTNTGHDVGVIAQDIEKVLPELVATRDNGFKAVRYEKIVALLIEAVKEQQSQIEELKAKL